MDPTIYHKTLPADEAIKSIDDESGWFEGYASTFDKDLAGDAIQQGAFRRTLGHKGGAALPIFLNHESNQIAGFNHEAREDERGLWVKGKLHLDTECGRMAYHLLKNSVMASGRAGLSIGFRVPSGGQKKNDSGGYDISELALVEYSVTPFPCQPEALVSRIKSTLPSITVEQALKAVNGDDSELDEHQKQHVEAIKELVTKVSETQRKAVEMDQTQDTKGGPIAFETALASQKDESERTRIEKALQEAVDSILSSTAAKGEKERLVHKVRHAYADACVDWLSKEIAAAEEIAVKTQAVKGMATDDHMAHQSNLAKAQVHMKEARALNVAASDHTEKAHGYVARAVSSYMTNNVSARELGGGKQDTEEVQTKSEETPDLSSLLAALTV